MSEQIETLISQVGTDSSGKWMSIDNVEELAKLIVRECINATGNCAGTGNMIKEHFGVEE